MARTRESQYECCFETIDQLGRASFGLMSNHVWQEDPKRLVFLLARYKFVAKMLSGMARVLEAGCADAFGSRIVAQEVGSLTVVDFDPLFIDDAQQRMDARWQFQARVHDMLSGPVEGDFDAAFALDVIEHIPAEKECLFVGNLAASLHDRGTLILGTPSIQSQAYASPASKAGHVNCKDAKQLKQLAQRWFHNVFLFSMNDEVVHTGFHPMAHYLIALCCNKIHPA